MTITTGLETFRHSPMDSIPTKTKMVQSTFLTHRTKPLEYRLLQLRKLYWGLVDHSDAIIEASKYDLGRCTYETCGGDLDWCKGDILFITKNLEKWIKDEKAPDIPFPMTLLSPRIRKDPLGAVLIIGTWNYPIQNSLGALIGAIAAGCTAVVKPSEVAPYSAMVVKKIMEECLDPEAYVCINGGISETTALLDEKWDKIFYTGSTAVGTIVAKKAAETLTPVCLELGGRNPAIITKNADVRLAARRLLWGKFINAGQVCISQNYTLVQREVFPTFIEQMKVAMKEFYPDGAKASPDYCRVVNQHHFDRLVKMLEASEGRILIGGDKDASDNFIEPTVLEVFSEKDSTMIAESFGPLMPVMQFDSLNEAIRVANKVHGTPLGLYPFGNKIEIEKILSEIKSGGASVNDSFFHGSIPTLAFGGVGDSGQGAFRGRTSFDCFTHRRSITTTPGWVERLINVRYPPYAGKLEQLRKLSDEKPDFDREGIVKKSVVGLVLNPVGGVTGALVLALTGVSLWMYREDLIPFAKVVADRSFFEK